MPYWLKIKGFFLPITYYFLKSWPVNQGFQQLIFLSNELSSGVIW